MARSLNRCEFIGNLGSDPDMKYLPSGDAIANFSIACNNSWKDKETGDKKEHTEWIRMVAFGKTAEIIGEYAKKGAQMYVAGAMRTRKYEKDGTDRYVTEVVVNEFQFLGGKSDGAGKREEQQASAYLNAAGKAAGPKPSGNAVDKDLNEDVPF